MALARRIHRYTHQDYVALELSSSTKHEFLDGEIYAMAGETEEQSALAAEVLRALGNAIGDRPCRAHTSDLRGRITVHGQSEDGTWTTRVAIAGGQVVVESLGFALRTDEIYRGSKIV